MRKMQGQITFNNEITVWSTGRRILRGKNRSTQREICPPKTHNDWPQIEPMPYRGEASD